MSVSLAELQKRVQESVLSGDAACLDLIKPSPRDTVDTMFSVYRNAYRLRLAEFLANDHEKLKFYLGDAQFRTMALTYIAATPSDQPNARWYSRKLPEFLAEHEPYCRSPILRDLAALERALNDAFDAPDQTPITLNELAIWPAESFAEARFDFHASLSLVRVSNDISALWAMLKADTVPGSNEFTVALAADGHGGACASRTNSAASRSDGSPVSPEPSPGSGLLSHAAGQNFELDGSASILIWRQGAVSRFRTLSPEEQMALANASDGVPFGVICEMISVIADPDTAAMRAATYLRGWIEGEMITAISCGQPTATS